MNNKNINCVDFTPTVQTEKFIESKLGQILNFVSAESDVKVFIRKVKSEIAYQGFLLMTTTFGEFKVCVDDESPEQVVETLEKNLVGLVNSKKKFMSNYAFAAI